VSTDDDEDNNLRYIVGAVLGGLFASLVIMWTGRTWGGWTGYAIGLAVIFGVGLLGGLVIRRWRSR
jgi:hypothetical protein